MKYSLYPSALGEHSVRLLQASLTLLDLIFPDRIKACYLTGSSIDGTAVTIAGDALNSSDLDITIVFSGNLSSQDRERFALWRTMCEQLGPFHLDQLDATFVCETELAQQGHLTLKRASVLLYGEDIRAAIVVLSLQDHLTQPSSYLPIISRPFTILKPQR